MSKRRARKRSVTTTFERIRSFEKLHKIARLTLAATFIMSQCAFPAFANLRLNTNEPIATNDGNVFVQTTGVNPGSTTGGNGVAGSNNTAIGNNAAAGTVGPTTNNTSLGQAASAQGGGSTAIGQGATSTVANGTAVGQGATAAGGANATALGTSTTANGGFSTAAG
ncbi:MAG: hypothetical protein K2Z81_07680, partial [Cyanobacteria bacterium]|nr:hypothetical protein [Cyanobacteriota bacterium]